MVIDFDFIVYVKKDGFKMENIVKDLMEYRKDLIERDCVIIFVGICFFYKCLLMLLILM